MLSPGNETRTGVPQRPVPHVGSEGGIGGEHGLVLAGHCALQGKLEGEALSSGVKSLLFQGKQARLIAKVSITKDKQKLSFGPFPSVLTVPE